MWDKIKLLFSKKNTRSVIDDKESYSIDEYDGVHYTFDSCPSCGYKFESKPKRKKKCPECNAYTFVRTNYKLSKKILLSKEGVEQLEENRSKNAYLNRWVSKLGEYGISEKVYYKRYKKACDQKVSILTHSDFIWSMFKQLVSDTKDPHRLQMIYLSMALFLREENKDFYNALRESKKWELLNYKKDKQVKKVEILAANDSCDTCKKQEGEIFTISKALKNMPIPCKDCTYYDNFCRCSYLPVIEH